MKETTNAVIYCEPVKWNDNDVKLSPVLINKQPYFIAVEVCQILDLVNPTDRLKSLDDDEKLTYVLDRSGQKRNVNLVNESGLYSLIFQSRKPQAKKFRKWVTSEVLPSIRKTGKYELSSKPSPQRIYKRRGELVNAELTNLLWLIGENLNRGDQKEIAIRLGVSVQSVYYVLNGYCRSSRILNALYNKALANREGNKLYLQPKLMAEKLLGESSESFKLKEGK